MVCGTAPFRPKAGGGIEELLKIILESEKKGFAFPATVSLSAKLKFLIQQLLQVNPIKRFSIEDVIKHDWVRDEYAQLEQERVQTSIFLKRIQSGKPEEPEMLKSEEIAVDAYEKEGNLDVSIRPIVYHTRYLIEELNRCINMGYPFSYYKAGCNARQKQLLQQPNSTTTSPAPIGKKL
jgi:serine/threonine protein kinase